MQGGEPPAENGPIRGAQDTVERLKREFRGSDEVDDEDAKVKYEWLQNLINSKAFGPKDGLAVADTITSIDDEAGFEPGVLGEAPTVSMDARVAAAGELARAGDFPALEAVETSDVVRIIARHGHDPREYRNAIDVFEDEPRWNAAADDPHVELTGSVMDRIDTSEPEEIGCALGSAVEAAVERGESRANARPLGRVEGAGAGIVADALGFMSEHEEIPMKRVTGLDVARVVAAWGARRGKNGNSMAENQDLVEEASVDDRAADVLMTDGVSAEETLRVFQGLREHGPDRVDPETFSDIEWEEGHNQTGAQVKIDRVCDTLPETVSDIEPYLLDEGRIVTAGDGPASTEERSGGPKGRSEGH